MNPRLTILCLALVFLAPTTPARAMGPAPDASPTRAVSQVPPIGVHPRIFFGPDDLPDIRERAQTTKMGAFYRVQIKKHLDDTIRQDESQEQGYYRLLASGADVPKLRAVPYEPFARTLMYEAFDALLDDDAARGEIIAAALANYARNYHYDRLAAMEDSWSYLFSHDVSKFMALAYDFTFNWMTEEQRAVTRAEIARMIYAREPYGWRQPRWKRAYNHVGDHMFIVWANYAIEGEEGYQPELTRKTMEVTRDYANLGLHPSGFGAESVVYTYFGFDSTARTMLAFARRGVNMFADTNYRFYKNYLLFNSVQFDPTRIDSHGDGGQDALRVNSLLKYMYPDDPQVDYLHRLAVAEIDKAESQWGYFGYQWLFGVVTAMDPEPEGPETLEELNLPLSVFCPDRGQLILRTGWSTNDVKFDVECREDISIIGHQHSSRGGFYLQALGRDWVVDQGYHQAESHRHSLVHIDGKGQSGWPGGPGAVLAHRDGQHLATIVCDAKYAYDWALAYGHWLQQPGYSDGWEQVYLPYRDRFPPEMTAELDLKERRGDGTFGWFPDRIWRRPYNPVERALRTAVLAKGPAPYVLIFDDIRKDDQERLYEWMMQVADDLEVKSANGRSLILGGKDSADDAGAPRMLVRLLDVNRPTPWPSLKADVETDRAMSLRLERYVAGRAGYEGNGLNARVVIPAISADPRYKVLLYPFRDGDPMPITKVEDGVLTVGIGEQEDLYTLGRRENGQTVFTMTRDGRTVAEMPSEARRLPRPETVPEEGAAPEAAGLLAHYTFDEMQDARPAPELAELAGLRLGSFPEQSGENPDAKADLVKLVDGVRGQAVWFDGAWSDVLLPLKLKERTDAKRKRFTASLWVKPETAGGSLYADGGHRGVYLHLHNGWCYSACEVHHLMRAPFGDAFLGKWSHVAIVRDGPIAQLYVNGQLVAGRVQDSTRWNLGDPVLGRGFRGAIDEVRVYNTALSAEDIRSLYERR